MYKKIFSLLLLLSGIAFAQFSPKAVITPTFYDFGDIKAGTVVNHDFKISNDGNDQLEIKDVRASCGCTAANPDKSILKPNESTIIKVSFNSEGRSGKQNKIVYVETNDPDNPTLKINFTCNVVEAAQTAKGPKLSFREDSHDFGKVREGKVVDYTFHFVNSGTSTLDISGVKTSCGCTAALISSKVIESGKEGTLRVELDTSNRSGKMTRNIMINSNDPQQPQITLTVSAEVIKES